MARLTPFVALLAFLLGSAGPPPTQRELDDAEHARAADLAAQQAAAERARAAAEQEKSLADSRVTAAERLRAAEEELGSAAAKVAELTVRRKDAEAQLAARAASMAPVLPVIERLSLYPAETLLAVPVPPEDAMRGVLVLGGLARTLEHEAAALRDEQVQLASLRAEMAEALPQLAAARADQARLAQDLDAQIAQAHRTRRAAEDATTEAARRAAADAARADSIRAAISRIAAASPDTARLDADRQAAETRLRDAALPSSRHDREAMATPFGSNMADARGKLTAPVAGSVVRAFGAETEAGPASGVSYQAPPKARVVSPCGGRVVFAGPFRSFGLLMIVDCGGGYHFVMSGLDRLDGQVGQTLQAGEPVGVMPAWDPQSPAENRPTLYLELRKDGVPVNPAPFLRARS